MNNNTIAIIPARGGSKRIPRKNIKDFLGRPIIANSIKAAIDSNLFDEVMVSTDDEEIADVAIKLGARVPFFRSLQNSTDFAGTAEVLMEVLRNYEQQGRKFKNACCIYPASPLISVQSLTEAHTLLESNKFDNVFPICQFSSQFFRALRLNQLNKVEMIWPENLEKRSQDLSASFYDAGQFYWFNVNAFLDSKQILTTSTGAIVLDEMHTHDIDTMVDWKIAEMKYKINNNIL